jgi:hypothetical protein
LITIGAPRKKWLGSSIKDRRDIATTRRRIRGEQHPLKRRLQEIAFTREHIDKALLDEEAALNESCWLAYGYMTPLERTELFCLLYLRIFRHYFEKYRNWASAADQNPIDPELFRNDRREITSFWRARQMADEIGMPYETYLNAVMEWATTQKNRKEYPRPNQLYRVEQIEAALNDWERLKPVTPMFTDEWDDRFFKQNPRLDPPRRKALLQALTTLKVSPRRDFAFANLIGRWDALSEEDARRLAERMFPDTPHLMEDALRYRMEPHKVRTGIEFKPYQPTCLGMRETISGAPCSQCQFMQACKKARAMTDAILQSQAGSVDPVANRKREQNRNRQRRKRERDRARDLTAAASIS